MKIIVVDGVGVKLEDGKTPLSGNHVADALPPSENDYCIALRITYGDIVFATAGDSDGEYVPPPVLRRMRRCLVPLLRRHQTERRPTPCPRSPMHINRHTSRLRQRAIHLACAYAHRRSRTSMRNVWFFNCHHLVIPSPRQTATLPTCHPLPIA